MFRLEEANRLRLEEENMLQLAKENNKKKKEFMNSSHGKKNWPIWLSDDIERFLGQPGQHIDLWVDYMWHVRPENANWAMVSSYFVYLILQNGMPLFYANGDRHATPWSEVDQMGRNSGNGDVVRGLADGDDGGDGVVTGRGDFKLARETYVMCQELTVQCQERHEQIIEMQRLIGSNVTAESVRLLREL
ncbi:hypothetical protein Tco_1524211 [Tanacetum coccineum]